MVKCYQICSSAVRFYLFYNENTKKCFKPGTFCVWGKRDNHYTTETVIDHKKTAYENLKDI